MTTKSGDVVITKVAGRVSLPEMRRPPNNFFDKALLTDVADALLALDDDEDVSCVVLASEGTHFAPAPTCG